MNNTERLQKQHAGPHLDGSKPQRPLWKRIHHSPFFWVGAFFMLLAMGVFVFTDGFLLRSRGSAPAPAPVIARP